jgi:hypothetical protein
MAAAYQKEDFFLVKTGVFSTALADCGVLWWSLLGEGGFFMHFPRLLGV